MADVTIAGTGGTVSINFGSDANAQAAQQALANVAKFLALGADAVVNIPDGTGTLPPPDQNAAATVGIVGDFGTQSQVQGQVPAGYSTLINTNSGLTVLAGAQDTTLVESGANAEFLYANTANNAQVYLGGGINEVFNAFNGSSMTVNLSGPSAPGAAAAAIVDGAFGQTTVNVGAGALLDVLQGSVSVVAQTGTETVEVSAPTNGSTSAVTVSGVAGSTLFYIPGGGDAFLNPGAGNIVVFGSALGGSETLFGGAATVGGQALNATAFTGSATVIGGNGYFQGGSAGNNDLTTSTVAGAATLIGGGNGDQLFANASGDLLMAGGGNETLSGLSTQGGNIFVTGNASASSMVQGDANGNDTIKLGSGNATIGLQHAGGIGTITSGNLIMEQNGISGGDVTINGFIPSAVGFGTLDMVSLNAGVTASLSVVGGNTVATLSDGTSITFTGVNGAPNSNSGLSITNHGSFLT